VPCRILPSRWPFDLKTRALRALLMTIGAGARNAQRITSRPGANVLRSSPRGCHERLPPGGFPSCDLPNSAETFLGTAMMVSACLR
jgi:hypothetical protein